MPERPIQTWLDIAPAYLDFGVKFLRNPAAAFAGLGVDDHVSGDLTNILLGGVALSYFVVLAAGTPELRDEEGTVATFLRWLAARDRLLIPAAALAASLLLGVAAHLLAGTLPSLLRLRGVGLGGTMKNSVNAAVGYGTVFFLLALLR